MTTEKSWIERHEQPHQPWQEADDAMMRVIEARRQANYEY